MTTGRSVRRPVTAAVGGLFIVVCAVTAALSVTVSDTVLTPDSPGDRLHFPPVVWPLLLALAGGGVAVMMRHRWARAAALLAAIAATQLAGTAVIAVRAWFTVKGFGGSGSLTATPITYAATVAVAASAAAVAAAAVVWREPADGWRSLAPARPGYVAAGSAVVVLLPQTWNAAAESGDITGLAAIATLTYALPWGMGVAVVGWMRGRSGGRRRCDRHGVRAPVRRLCVGHPAARLLRDASDRRLGTAGAAGRCSDAS